MAEIRPRIVVLRLLIVAMLVLGLGSTALAAAPGLLKAEPPPTETSDADLDGVETGPDNGMAAPVDADRNRLDYRGAASPDGAESELTTSHRASTTGRTAAGSSPPEEDAPARAIPEPEVERAPRPEPEPPEFADAPYDIHESGRPRHSSDSVLVYDGDPTTSWSAGTASPQAYVWLDLGETRPVSGLRWFQPVVDGPIAIQLSADRQTWTTVVLEEQPVAGTWQEAVIGQPARFVRIVVGNQSQTAELAEVQVFGPPGAEPADVERATGREQRGDTNRPPNVTITGGDEQGRQAAAETVVVTPEPDSEAVEITVNGQTARCIGGERCRVETPRPEVVEDCGDGTTTCTIRISNSGGLAVCDSAGGNRGRNSRNGGRCSAEASGGTVTVSDVDR